MMERQNTVIFCFKLAAAIASRDLVENPFLRIFATKTLSQRLTRQNAERAGKMIERVQNRTLKQPIVTDVHGF